MHTRAVHRASFRASAPAVGTVRRPTQLHLRHISQASSSSSSLPEPGTSYPAVELAAAGTPSSNGVYPAGQQAAAKPGFLTKLKEMFTGSKAQRDKLASLGMGATASYGVISNVTYGTCLTIAWLAFVKGTGKVPTDPGQWPPFLAFYMGFWTMQNFVRPMRFALALALAPTFDKVIDGIAKRLNVPKPVGFGLLLVCIAMTTIVSLFSALYFLGGFPNGVPFLGIGAAS